MSLDGYSMALAFASRRDRQDAGLQTAHVRVTIVETWPDYSLYPRHPL